MFVPISLAQQSATPGISSSLRFRGVNSSYLSRTPASTGNRQSWTFSAWIKRGVISTTQGLFGAYASATNATYLTFTTGDQITFTDISGSTTQCVVTTTPVYRDTTSWFHLVVTVDYSNATDVDRVRFYVNGNRHPATFTTIPTTSYNTYLNVISQEITIGKCTDSSAVSSYFDGYMTDVYFVDGNALTGNSFGQTNTSTDSWISKNYDTNSLGTNGSFLNFSDGTSITTLGHSPNSNNWTLSGISLTADVTYDLMKDIPSNNYPILNVLNGSGVTFERAALRASVVSGNVFAPATMAATGLTYCEATVSAGSGNLPGIVSANQTAGYPGSTGGGYGWFQGDGKLYFNGVAGTTLDSFAVGDVLMQAFDSSTGKWWLGKNGTWVGSGNPANGTNPTATLSTSEQWFFSFGASGGADMHFNFGQQPFVYTPPSGFNALCSNYLSIPTIIPNQHFDVLLWSGDSTLSRTLSGLNFSPNFVWGKARNTTANYQIYDSLRTFNVNKEIPISNVNEGGTGTATNGYLSGTTSNGFTTTGGSTDNALWNLTGSNYVAWCLKANGSGVTNNAGTIQSTVSVNSLAGFSIITYTGDGNSNATVGHGLGVKPAHVFYKCRNVNGLHWLMWNQNLGNNGANDYYINFTPSAKAVNVAAFPTGLMSSSVIPLGTSTNLNGSGSTYVAYCFAEVPGFSKFGIYVGTGSFDGAFVYCGFKPHFIMIKNITQAGPPVLIDSARNTYNVGQNCFSLSTGVPNPEIVSPVVDFLANGFKIRNNFSNSNSLGKQYIFIAFAENPFKYANAV